MSKNTLLVAVIAILFVLFVIIRVLWQKGAQPLRNLSGVSYIAIAVLVAFLIIIWYIHKKTQAQSQ
jgi:uncharacterized membrane protein